MNSQDPLLNVPNGRQAVATLRGYVYQVWHTILAWIRLNDDEALYLEMAEDFDLHAPAGATVVQVKHSDAHVALSLGSGEAATALNNYWALTENNKGTQVRFRLLTTWNRGFERGSPFAPETGLDYWDSCRNDPSRIPKLRDYLLQLDGLSFELLAFLRQADALGMQQQLVACVHWDTGRSSLPSMEQLVDEALAALAEKCGFPVLRTRLETLRSALLAHAVTRITDRNPSARRLTRMTCLDVMRQAISVQVPLDDWDRINSQLNELAALKNALPPDVTSTKISESLHGRLMTLPPDDDARWVRRVQCSACVDLVRRLRIVFLHASRGTGKSSLARQIANGVGGDWLVVDLQGHDSRAVGEILQGIHALMDSRRTTASLVVDNIDVHEAVDQYEVALASIIRRQHACNAAVIVTATSPVRKDFLRRCGIAEDAMVSVARFEDSEIRQCLQQAGCHQPLVDQWIKVTCIATGSHPQLVHAFVLDAQQRGWPTPQVDDVIRPASVQEEREQAFSRLLGTPPASLAMRVSMLPGVFRRDVAMALADAHPPLPGAATSFESLVGPWLEPVARDYYRVSPLLAGASVKLPRSELTSAAAAGAIATLKRRHLAPTEFGGALMLSIMASHDALIARCAQVIASPRESATSKELAEELQWLLALGINGAAYPSPYVNLMLRMAQATIAGRLQEWARLAQIMASWRTEIAAITNPIGRHMFTTLFATRFLLDVNAPYDTGVVVDTMNIALGLSAQGSVLGAPSVLPGGGIGTLPTLLDLQAARIKSATQLLHYVEALDKRPSLLDHLIRRWNSGEGMEFVDGMCSRAWLAECERGGLGPQQCEKLLERGLAVVAKWSCAPILAQFAQALAVVRQEYLNDATGAHQALDEAESFVGSTNKLLILQRGKLYYQQRCFKEAAPLFVAGRSVWQSNAITGAFGARMAAINCGELDDLESAEQFLREAIAFAASDQPVMRLGLELDLACVQFLRKRLVEAIALFAAGISEYERAYLGSKDALHLSLRRRIAHVLIRLSEGPGATSESRNLVGWISSQDPFLNIQSLSEQPWQTTWLLLRELCVENGVSVAVVEPHISLETIRRSGMMTSLHDMQNLMLACEGGEVQGVVAACLRAALYAKAGKADPTKAIQEVAPPAVSGLHLTTEYVELVGMTMWLAITATGLREGWPSNAEASWRRQADELELKSEDLEKWITACGEVVTADGAQLADLVQHGWLGSRLLAASRVVVENRGGPAQWWASAAIVMQGAARTPWKRRFARQLAHIFQSRLRALATSQAFALRTPQWNVPILLRVAEEENQGWPTCATCCLHASDALGVRVDARVAALLKEWAERR